MKKQTFLYFGVWLSLFNIISFPMQPAEHGNNSCAKPPLDHELEETRLFHPRVAEKYIEGLTAARVVIDSVLRHEKARAAVAAECHDEISFGSHYFRTPMFLLEGPRGSGKSKTAKAIASILGRKLTIIDFFRFELHNPSGFIPVKDRLDQILSQNNKPRVVVLEDIEELTMYHHEEDKKYYSILDLLPFIRGIENEDDYTTLDTETKKQDENWMKSKFVILATTSCRDRIPPEILQFFGSVKIKHPNFERRSIILKNLLESEDHIIDISPCTQEVIGQLAEKTDGFSVRELKKLVKMAQDYAFELFNEDENGDRVVLNQEILDSTFDVLYPYTKVEEAKIKVQKEEAERQAKAAAVEREDAAEESVAQQDAPEKSNGLVSAFFNYLKDTVMVISFK